jgi:archaellum biogenesis ATPase FlaH
MKLSKSAAKTLKIATIVSMILAGVFWLLTLWGWYQEDAGFEVLHTLASAIFSTLVSIFGWLKRPLNEKESNLQAGIFSSTCGDQPIRLQDQRVYTSLAFGNYFAGLLEREHGYVNLEDQINAIVHDRSDEYTGLQSVYSSLHDPRGPNVVVIAGEGGMGKSTVAARIVRCLYQRGVADMILGDSAKAQRIDVVSGEIVKINPAYYDVNSFLSRITNQLGFTSNNQNLSKRELLQLIRDRILGRRVVIVLDNLETLEEGTDLLRIIRQLASPNVRILVTTRNVTGLTDSSKNVLLISLKPIRAYSTARTFIEWHIETYGSSHPNPQRVLDGLAKRKQIQRLIDKTGGIPLIIQLVTNDIGYTSWECVDSLPNLFSSQLLTFLYKQRWAELSKLGTMGQSAMELLSFVNEQQAMGRTVTHQAIIQWAEKNRLQESVENLIQLLSMRFLLVNHDSLKGNYVIFPSLAEFLNRQRDRPL